MTLKPKLWTLKAIEEAIVLVSAGQSMVEVGNHFGVSRQAVAGILFRARASGRIITAGLPGRHHRTGNEPFKPPTPHKAAKPAVATPVMIPVGLMERTGCAFPVGRTTQHLFCNNTCDGNSSYCGYHSRLMVQPFQASPKNFVRQFRRLV
jgi:hypothetical protein